MFRTYKTNREPKNANSLAHAILTDQGFKLVSFQRRGHELGSFNYSMEVNGLPIHVSVTESCAASPRATLFCESHYLHRLSVESLWNCDFPKIAAAWLAIRPCGDKGNAGRVSHARTNAVQLI
jgi:hypothetical protein